MSDNVVTGTGDDIVPCDIVGNDIVGDIADENVVKTDDSRPDYPWKRAKKVAAMLSFSGKTYFGMQRNPGDEINTIEDELLGALSKSGAIDPTWEKAPQKAFFTRASRTDKGVSAARMVVSLKMLQENDTVEKVNQHLPPDIRLQGIVRVTKNFNCQSQPDARTYLYLTPTLAFSPVTEVVTESWRCGPDTISQVNKVLEAYKGVHYHHNFTSGKLPMEPSSQRFIMEFEASDPFEKDGLEWTILKVKGQSFMIHQIRKMVGLAMAIVRGHTSMATLEEAWGDKRIDIPRAPGLGLMLDTIHYDRYAKRYCLDGSHQDLEWSKENEAVEKFKEDFIFSDITNTEVNEKSMMEFVGQVLPMHTFTPRHFESGESVNSKMGAAQRMLGRKDKEDSSDILEGNEDADVVVEEIKCVG